MTDSVTPPPAIPPAGDPPPDPKPAEKKLLDDLKKQQSKNKDLETKVAELSTKLAEALPYVEKFKGHEDAKALEEKRAAETRAKQESDARASQELEGKRERAILKALIGVVPQGDSELGEFAQWKLSTDPSIVFDAETGTFTGLTEAVEALKASPRFAAGKPGEPPKKAAPGLPDTKKDVATVDPKFANVKTLQQLVDMGETARAEFERAYPARYEALRAANIRSARTPVLASSFAPPQH